MSIQVLPTQLANQIAAGEVVERPASVVKELIENSLDAGATRIDIDIEKGGAGLIRIRDNGCGIPKDDLVLALARHATSKIATLDDLEAIITLGFRGEALASISAVSRLTLTSRTETQQEAWSAYAEGREMEVTVKPAAHPPGTTLEILDLFYNTPARRKFMRTEKTEFTHIDEVVRRIALARFDVTIFLTHNGKLVRQYRGISEVEQRERRLGAICGTAFLQHALAVTWQHGDLGLQGWVADPKGARVLRELQYFYVNGRMMRDRLINHAIRQAYQDKIGSDHQPAYVLYFNIAPHQVDVNVHPAKQEVRFQQSRLVHDFIYQGVVSVVQGSGVSALSLQDLPDDGSVPENCLSPVNRAAAGSNQFAVKADEKTRLSSPSVSEAAGQQSHARMAHRQPYQPREGALYQRLMQPVPSERLEEPPADNLAASVSELPAHGHSFGRMLTVLSGSYALLHYQEGLQLMSLTVAERWFKRAQFDEDRLKSQPLLIPLRIKVAKTELLMISKQSDVLQKVAIDIRIDGQYAILFAVPFPLRHQNLQILLPELLIYLANQPAVTLTEVKVWLAERALSEKQVWNHAQAVSLLADLERCCPRLVKSPPVGLVQQIDIESAINTLRYV